MSAGKDRVKGLKRIGGALCLDFANTTGWRADPGDEEVLRDYEDLAGWAEHAEALTPREAAQLRRLAAAEPEKARAAHRRAIALREAIYRSFSAVAAKKRPDARDLDLLNGVIGEAHRHLCLAPIEGGFAWEWQHAETELELPLWQVARSAADLLVSPDLGRVRECSGERCDWLFVDESRNRSRRWCDMANCGNRAKARRNYARRKASGTALGSWGARP